mmetsp:Transcript_37265/g.49117  ORF Transcript_37265/g.49117 Transcript_37265/m.49117 type:complete len:294 (-) Transcript_37265:473-1354(-)
MHLSTKLKTLNVISLVKFLCVFLSIRLLKARSISNNPVGGHNALLKNHGLSKDPGHEDECFQKRRDFCTKSVKIGPSILAADMSRMAAEAQRILDCGADYIHLDVFDGHFCENLTFGPPVVKCLRGHVKDAILSVHLSVTHPDRWIDAMADAGADVFTFHIEAEGDPAAIIKKIKVSGMLAGCAVAPSTPVEQVLPYAQDLDLILLMTVEPGFGGQNFQYKVLEKVKKLRELYPELILEVDGGLNLETVPVAAGAGANWFVSGTTIFNAANPSKVIADFRSKISSSQELNLNL